MTQTPAPGTKAPTARIPKPAEEPSTGKEKSAVGRTAELSGEVLETVEAGQRAAIDAVRKFVETVDEMLPAMGDRPSRRETVIDGALEMAEKLVTAQYDFLRSIVRNVDRSLGKPDATEK